MAVTGVFAADFASFYEACQKAELHLKGFEQGGAKVEKQMNAVANSFSGTKIIQEATAMSIAIEKSGGITKLTASELQRAGAVAQEAAAKMKALGQEVTPDIQSVVDASKNLANSQETVRSGVGGLSSAYRQFDGVLQSVGINIGPQVKAVEDIGGASGKSAASVGMLGSAGLVAGAAFAGWSLGRNIAEFFDLDKKIANATATMMGWGNLVEQEMAAAADTLALASEKAGRVIRDMAKAVEILEDAKRKETNRSIDWEARMNSAREAAFNLTEGQIRQIQTARDLGATTEQLKDKFGVTADVLIALDAQMAVTTANEAKMAAVQTQASKQRQKNAEDELKARERVDAALGKLIAENAALEIKMSGTTRDARIADIEAEFRAEVESLTRKKEMTAETMAALERQRDLKVQAEMADFGRLNDISRSSIEQRAEYELATLEAMQSRHGEFSATQIAQQKEIWLSAKEAVLNFGLAGVEAADAVASGMDHLSESVEQTISRVKKAKEELYSMSIQPLTQNQILDVGSKGTGMEMFFDEKNIWNKLKELEAMEGTYAPKNNNEYFQMLRDQALLAQLRMWASGRNRPPGFASGVENFQGGLAYVHKDEMLVNLPKGTDVIPAGRGMGGAGMTVVVNMSGMVGDKFGLARVVKRAVLDAAKGKGQMITVGAPA